MEQNLPAEEVAIHKESNLAYIYEVTNNHFKEGNLDEALKVSEKVLLEARSSNDVEWAKKFDTLHSTLYYTKLDKEIKKIIAKAKRSFDVFKYADALQLYLRVRKDLDELYKLGREPKKIMKRKVVLDEMIKVVKKKLKESSKEVSITITGAKMSSDIGTSKPKTEMRETTAVKTATLESTSENIDNNESLPIEQLVVEEAEEPSVPGVIEKIFLLDGKKKGSKKAPPVKHPPSLKPPSASALVQEPVEKEPVKEENKSIVNLEHAVFDNMPKKMSGPPQRLTKPIVPPSKKTPLPKKESSEPKVTKIAPKAKVEVKETKHQQNNSKPIEVQASPKEEMTESALSEVKEEAKKIERASASSVESPSIQAMKLAAIKKELVPPNKIQEYIKNLTEDLEELNFSVIKTKSTRLAEINNLIDLLAVKIVEVKNDSKILLILPIKMLNLIGAVILSENEIDYAPENQSLAENSTLTNRLVNPTFKAMNRIHDKIFNSITSESPLFNLINKYIGVRTVLEKTCSQRQLFLRNGSIQYSLIIEPVVVTTKKVKYMEGIVPFPYLRCCNAHYIQLSRFSRLTEYLTLKYSTLEEHQKKESSVELYFKQSRKFFDGMKYISIVPVAYGMACFFVALFQQFAVLNTLIGIGSGLMCVYFAALIVLYYKFYTVKSELSEEFNTPYYKRKVSLQEDEMMIICEGWSSDMFDQFWFECFGKMTKSSPSFASNDKEEESQGESELISESNEQEVEKSKTQVQESKTIIEEQESEEKIEDMTPKTTKISEKRNRSSEPKDLNEKYKKFFE